MASSSPLIPVSPVSPPPSIPSSPKFETSEKSPSALKRLHGVLRQLLRITVTDGRVFLGTFAGTDKPLNILLINAEEYRVGPGQDPDGRYVGQVMLPWKVVVKVEAHIPERPTRAMALDGMYI